MTELGSVTARERLSVGRLAASVAALASCESGGIHLLEAANHGKWWLVAGVFFAFLGLFQIASGIELALRPGVARLRTVVWVNAITIFLYLASRSVGLPLAPPVPLHGVRYQPGVPVYPVGKEPVGVTDYTVAICEVVVVVACVYLLDGTRRRRMLNCLMAFGLAAFLMMELSR